MNNKNLPTLICFFSPGDENQKEYCLKIKDNFKHRKKIRYIIESTPDNSFCNIYDIQNIMIIVISK